MTVTSGVYVIRNSVDERVYVGCSVDIRVRWNSHRTALRKRRHQNSALQEAWLAYGESAFRIEVLEVLAWPMPAELSAAERRHFKIVGPAHLYNKLPPTLCRALGVQPGDILEYTADPEVIE